MFRGLWIHDDCPWLDTNTALVKTGQSSALTQVSVQGSLAGLMQRKKGALCVLGFADEETIIAGIGAFSDNASEMRKPVDANSPSRVVSVRRGDKALRGI